MISTNNSNLKFGANFITTGTIQKKTFLRNSHQAVSFVEFDKKSSSDIKAVLKLCKNWKNTYLNDILYHLTSLWGEKTSIFFLTTQNNNLRNLDENKILGTITAYPKEKDVLFIDFLQVNPEFLNKEDEKKSFISNLFRTKYRYCGTEMLNCLKNVFPQKNIETLPAIDTTNFYKNNGFKQKAPNLNYYIYTRQTTNL